MGPIVLRASTRTRHAVLHGNVGALQLLRDARAAHPVHDGDRGEWRPGFRHSKAGAIYGLYTAMVYLLACPAAGWRTGSSACGGPCCGAASLSRCGHFCMAIPTMDTFYLGLALIVIGTGLLKTNVSTLVGSLYAENDARRDAGFSIYYMGINMGALIAPLVCGYLGENINWHYGFGAAGVGMTAGVIQYALGGKYLGERGLAASRTPEDFRLLKRGGIAIVAVAGVGNRAGCHGVFSAERLSDVFGVLLTAIVVVVLLLAALRRRVTRRESGNGSARFWFCSLRPPRSGRRLNRRDRRSTCLPSAIRICTRGIFRCGDLFRASYFQSFNSIFIIALAPVFAWLWMRMGRREPSSTAKFSPD